MRLRRVVAVSAAVLSTSALAVGDSLDQALAEAGDAARGRNVFLARDGGHCVICHALEGVTPAGNVGPSLDGIGRRMTGGQIRLRIVDITRVNPDAAMPAFHRRDGLSRVAATYAGQPLLAVQQVEDLVAFLGSLR